MCLCYECGGVLPQGYFTMRIRATDYHFCARCLPKSYYQESPDRRKDDQLNLPFEKGGDKRLD